MPSFTAELKYLRLLPNVRTVCRTSVGIVGEDGYSSCHTVRDSVGAPRWARVAPHPLKVARAKDIVQVHGQVELQQLRLAGVHGEQRRAHCGRGQPPEQPKDWVFSR